MASLTELTVQIAQLTERLRIARQGLATLDPNLPGNRTLLAGYQLDVDTLPAQIAALQSQLAALQGANSSGQLIREDQTARFQNANEVNPQPGLLTLENGRVQPAPDTTTSSNAVKSPPEFYSDFGTDDELRPYIQTQATPPATGFGPVREDAFVPGTIGQPTTQPGVGAASDDRGGANVVASLNSINFAEKIISQPNVLDQYASYTYSASIYLITKANVERLLNLGNRDLSSAKLLIQSGGISQTQRQPYFDLDYYIDDIEIRSVMQGRGSRAAHNVTDVKMKIIEPNGITLVENLTTAVREFVASTAPKPASSSTVSGTATQASVRAVDNAIMSPTSAADSNLAYTSQIYLLVLRFYGYDEQGNLVRGGKKATTTDPNSFVEKFYPLVIEKFDFRVAGKAAEYDIKFKAPQYILNGGQGRASLPFNFEFSGGTVNDVLAGPATYGINQTATATEARTSFAATDPRRVDLTDAQKGAPPKASAIIPNKKTVRQGLMAALNEYQQEQVKAGKIQYADEFNIEFALPAMAAASIVLPGVNKSTTAMSTPGTPADQKLGSKQSMDTKSQNVGATAGMQIVQFIDMVLRNSSYISDQQVLIVNNNTGEETPGPGVNLKNTAWYKIGFKAVPMMDKYDTIRNDYAYKMTYTVSPYKITQLYSPYFKYPEFNGVHKTYKYWFTGQNTSVLNYEETLNNLFFIALTNQTPAGESNINELIKRLPYTASGQASQGGQGRATEPAANAADQLYSPNELKECTMTIVGDPGWLQQGEAFSLLSSKDPTYYQPFLADGTINFDSQEVLFEVAFNTPRDYNLATGLILPSMTRNTELYPGGTESTGNTAKISRIYIVKECLSSFKQGKFTQQLKATLRIYNVPPAKKETPQSNKASVVAAPPKTKAIPYKVPTNIKQPAPSNIPASPGTMGAALNALDVSYEGASIIAAAEEGAAVRVRQLGAKDQ